MKLSRTARGHSKIRPALRGLALKGWLAALVAVVLAFGGAEDAAAHAALVRSEPSDNAILAEAPQEIRLWFNEAISAEFSSIQVLDINGQPIKLAGIRRDSADPMLMVVSLPDLSPGVYSLKWRVLSEADGHFTQGLMVFGIGEGADVGSVAAVDTQASIPWAEVVLRWLNFGLLAALVGALAARYLVLTVMQTPDSAQLAIIQAQGRVLAWAIWSGLGAFIVGLGMVAYQSSQLMQSLPEGVSFLEVSGQLLSRSRWGTLWLIRQAMLLTFSGMLLLTRSEGRREESSPLQKLAAPVAGLMAIGLMVVQALSGHAAAITPGTALTVAVDALHLLAVGLWLGTLLALAVGLLPLIRRRSGSFMELVRAGWGPFGRLAAPSVGIIAATGFFSMGRQVATPDALLSTLYGQALLGKIGLMMAVGAFGLLNSMLLHPRLAAPLAKLLRRPEGWTPLSLRRLPTLVLAEVGLGLLIFLAVGLVTASPPARGPEFTIVADDLLGSVSQNADDLLVTFSAKPNKPGQNVFNIGAISHRRPAPAEVMRVIVRFTFQGEDMGTVTADAEEIEPNLYRLGGSYLSLPGPWQVEVAVRRRGLEDSVARFDWTVAPAGETRPVILSNRSWEIHLTIVAGVMLVAILAAMAGRWLSHRQKKSRNSLQNNELHQVQTHP